MATGRVKSSVNNVARMMSRRFGYDFHILQLSAAIHSQNASCCSEPILPLLLLRQLLQLELENLNLARKILEIRL